MWTILEAVICGNFLYTVFSALYPVTVFSHVLCRLNCTLLCDSLLLIMSAKNKNAEIFSYFKKSKVIFLK